jgi:hypothetical protein
MKYDELKAAEEAKRQEAEQLRSGRTRSWTHDSGLTVTMTATDDGIAVALDSEHIRTSNVGSDPLQWLTSDQLRFVARCREKLEAWVAGGTEPSPERG